MAQKVEDESIRALLLQILQAVLQTSTAPTLPISPTQPKNIQQSNSPHAVLFEAINLAIHLASMAEESNETPITREIPEQDCPSPTPPRQVAALLGKFIT